MGQFFSENDVGGTYLNGGTKKFIGRGGGEGGGELGGEGGSTIDDAMYLRPDKCLLGF